MITKHIPNTITSLNLASGCVSIVNALNGNFETAAYFILLAAVFDFLDGFTARLLKTYSPIGKDLDSLSDVVSFGVAPGMIVYKLIEESCYISDDPSWLAWFALLIPVASALRLAKFNIDKRQATSFIGLPTPANALFWSFGIAFSYVKLTDYPFSPYLIIPFILIFSWLMISEVPMFSLKFKSFNIKKNRQKYLFLAVCLVLIALLGMAGVAACILWYIVLSVSSNYYSNKTDK